MTKNSNSLTQKLCQLVIEKSAQRRLINATSVSEIVQRFMIKNWEAQDEPEHLRTIGDRLFRNEESLGRLLGIYQQILQQGKLPTDGSTEQTELRLSGLWRYTLWLGQKYDKIQ
ncbi:MAG: hypothetical protein SWJ54_15845 [Cyanobacteriota bacterium]|nr:hypothetical protein [Cyanobacteriota bacterium]